MLHAWDPSWSPLWQGQTSGTFGTISVALEVCGLTSGVRHMVGPRFADIGVLFLVGSVR
jgi:hypothetical protein